MLAKKYHFREIALTSGGNSKKADNQASDASDYSDEDFKDLLTNEKIQQSLKEFFDRLKELINPIRDERLQLDTVNQVKRTVTQFYEQKQS